MLVFGYITRLLFLLLVMTTVSATQVKISFSISKDADVTSFREYLTNANCSLQTVVSYSEDFVLTVHDVAGLERCPLKTFALIVDQTDSSTCIEETHLDLSGLSTLSSLLIYCRHVNTTITALPTGIQSLTIEGFKKENIQLGVYRNNTRDDSNNLLPGQPLNVFGDSLSSLIVSDSRLCCPAAMTDMFGRFLTHVKCSDSGGDTCGIYAEETFIYIDNNDTFSMLEGHLERHRSRCMIEKIEIMFVDFLLTPAIMEILQGCPNLWYIRLHKTLCLSGMVTDLSSLLRVSDLELSFCRNLNFKITGLPKDLIKLSIEGLEQDNVGIEEKGAGQGSRFGDRLHSLFVTRDRHMCCPQVRDKMFGHSMNDLPMCGYINREKWITEANFWLISSCDHLVYNSTLRVMLWVVAIFAFLGNLLVIVYRLGWDRASMKKSHGLLVFNLNISDLLMGIYLLTLVYADTTFRGYYILEDKSWRHGLGCNFAGFISTLSSETSAMFILMITFDRFLAIQFPFQSHTMRTSVKVLCLACCVIWALGAFIAAVPLLMVNWEVYSFNSICVALPLHSKDYPGSTYATSVFIGMNSLMFVLIAVGQVAIYRAKWASDSKMKASMSDAQAKRRYKEDLVIARHLSLVVMTDFCCWFPICVMGVMSQTGHDMTEHVYAWSAVVVMPVNSAINPLLYTAAPALTHVVACLRRTTLCRQLPCSEDKQTDTSSTSRQDISHDTSSTRQTSFDTSSTL